MEGFHINDQVNTIKFINNKTTLEENLMIDWGDGYLMGFEVTIRGNIKEFISINKLHKLLGHPWEKYTQKLQIITTSPIQKIKCTSVRDMNRLYHTI